MKLGKYCILCTDQKKLQKMYKKVWLTLFKHGKKSYQIISEYNKFIYQFTNKLNLKTPNNTNIGLVNLRIYYTLKNITSAYNNNKFKISAPTWNDTFDLPDGSYSIYDIQDYF